MKHVLLPPIVFFFTTYYILYLQILFVVLNDLSVILIKFEVIHHIEMNAIFSSRVICKYVSVSAVALAKLNSM